jgi:hypothetical protein
VDLKIITAMGAKIEELQKMAEEIIKLGKGIQAVERNGVRLLASIKMLELNVCDVREVL